MKPSNCLISVLLCFMKAKLLLSALAIITLIHDASSQSIALTNLPQWATTQNLSGKVSGVVPANYRVLVYLYFEGYWYAKPFYAAPLTPILPDSTWSCDVTTGGCDVYAARYAAFLVPAGFVAPGLQFQNYLPVSLYQHPYVYRCRIPGSRTIQFSGLQWKVKGLSDNCAVGPSQSPALGNLWTDADTAVFIDEHGYLHLRIVYDSLIDKWKCTEVIADTSLGYGLYKFTVKSRLDSLDRNVVFSPFVYDEYGDTNYYREIDMEASRWGVVTDPNFQYVMQPWNSTGNRHRFNTTNDTVTIHQFLWKQDSVLFSSRKSDGALIHSWNYSGPFVQTPYKENARINLWLFSSNNKPADTASTIEIIVEKFDFENVLPAPANLSATKGTYPDRIRITWSTVPQSGFYMVYKSVVNNPVSAFKLSDNWISSTVFDDYMALPGQHYYYWVRAANNSQGSNTYGYSSGFSTADPGWINVSNYVQNTTITDGMDTCFDAAQNLITAGNGSFFIVENGGSATLVAGQRVQMLPGTVAHSGSHLHARIANGIFCGNADNNGMLASMTNHHEAGKAIEKRHILVYPNPTTGAVTILNPEKKPNETIVLEIWSSLGKVVLNERRANLSIHQISLAGSPSGIYILRIISNGGMESLRIIKQ